MQNFNELNLPASLLESLAKMQFVTPTPIQAQAIPVALAGDDILGSAQTGTGKTGAFAIPMAAYLMNNENSAALIMTPTRELAVQVMQMVRKMIGHHSPIKTALLIGGENMFRQFGQLQDDPRIIVGTPGRINDHLARKSLKLDNVGFLVLDETDRMLDMGFGVQIDKILTYMPQKRQTLLFSATLPQHIVRLSEKYMTDAVRIAVGSTNKPITAIKQEMIRVPQPEKYAALTAQLDARGGSIIVFVRTKHGCDRIARKLERESHSAAAIHGDLRQNKRDKVIRLFREKKIRILIATDVAARGLDVPHIEHVINYDLPQCPEDYIHRIGRTARAGAEGEAICLVAPEEHGKWAAIERLINGGEGSETPYQKKKGKSGRDRNSNGYGRKNEGFNQQRRKRKEHRKGQSWQRAQDERKEREAAAQPQQERFERKFERRDQKQSQQNGERFEKKKSFGDNNSKPWHKKREGGNDRPFQKREGGSDKPWQKNKKHEGASDRPAQKREKPDHGSKKRFGGGKPGQGHKKPWHSKGGPDGNKPFRRRDRNAA